MLMRINHRKQLEFVATRETSEEKTYLLAVMRSIRSGKKNPFTVPAPNLPGRLLGKNRRCYKLLVSTCGFSLEIAVQADTCHP